MKHNYSRASIRSMESLLNSIEVPTTVINIKVNIGTPKKKYVVPRTTVKRRRIRTIHRQIPVTSSDKKRAFWMNEVNRTTGIYERLMTGTHPYAQMVMKSTGRVRTLKITEGQVEFYQNLGYTVIYK